MKYQPKQTDQRGLASIIVVSIIIVVVSLISVGFAMIMDRELRQTTDNELAAQATYSAESGLNDAKTYVSNKLAAGQDPSTNNQCLTIDSNNDANKNVPPFVSNGSISGDFNNNPNDNIDKYTCIIINSRPSELIYDIDAGSTVTFKMIPYSSANTLTPISDIYFSWENTQYPGPPAALPLSNTTSYPLPKESDFGPNDTGMLEVTIYPIFNDNSSTGPNVANQDAVIARNARTYFLYSNSDVNSGAIGTMSYSLNGQFVNGDCNQTNMTTTPPTLPYQNSTPRYCNSDITNLPPGAEFYYVRIRAIYTNQSVSIQAANLN